MAGPHTPRRVDVEHGGARDEPVGPPSAGERGTAHAVPEGILKDGDSVMPESLPESLPEPEPEPEPSDDEVEVGEVLVVDEDPLAAARAERDEYLDGLRRLQAEFENYKKRVAKQHGDVADRAAASLIEKLLPVLDTLDLAAEHLGDADSSDAKALVAASSLLHGVLAKEGLERIDPLGEAFDPTAHEAVGHLPAEPGAEDAGSDIADGPLVDQVMRPGYRWHGAVVRPAMVTVRG